MTSLKEQGYMNCYQKDTISHAFQCVTNKSLQDCVGKLGLSDMNVVMFGWIVL